MPRGLTLAEWFRRTGQGEATRQLLWDPLATAILNETPERAAAVLFCDVFREAFLRRRDAARLVFLRARLRPRCTSGWPATSRPAAACVRRRALVEAVEVEGGRARAVRYVQRAETKADDARAARAPSPQRLEADAVVAAVPWSALPALVPEELRGAAAVRERGAAARARPSSPSSCGSTAWWSTAPWSGCATPRSSGCSTRAGSTAGKAPRSTWPSS